MLLRVVADKGRAALARLTGLRDGVLGQPLAAIDSIKNCLRRDGATWIKCPVCQAFRFTKGRNKANLARVPLVLCVTHPAAILRLIVAVIVDAVKLLRGLVSVARGPRGKYGKRAPFLAYRYPASTISSVVGAMRISAPLIHSVPNSVDAGSAARTIMPMAGRVVTFYSSRQAAARTRITEQLESANQTFRPTVTPAGVEQHVIRVSPLAEFLTLRFTGYNPCAESVTNGNAVRLHEAIIARQTATEIDGNRSAVTLDAS